MAAADTSIEKAFRILRVFSEQRAVLSLSDIQRECGLPMTTTHRTVRRLVDAGALETAPGNKYRIGFELWEIGTRAPRYGDLHRAAQSTMQGIFERIHLPVLLTARRGLTGVAVSRYVTERSPRYPRVGSNLPLHATGGGQVLLAHAPDEVVADVLAGPLQRFTSRTPTDPEQLREILERVRRESVAVSDRELHSDLMSVAAPVRDAQGAVTAALGIVVPVEHAKRQEWVRIVRRGAGGISRTLAAMHSIPPTYAAVRAVSGR